MLGLSPQPWHYYHHTLTNDLIPAAEALKKPGRCVLQNVEKTEQIILYFEILEIDVFYMEG